MKIKAWAMYNKVENRFAISVNSYAPMAIFTSELTAKASLETNPFRGQLEIIEVEIFAPIKNKKK